MTVDTPWTQSRYWEIEETEGRITLYEVRDTPEGQEDAGSRAVYLGHVHADPESMVPDYYPSGHAIYARIDAIRQEYAGRITWDDLRRENGIDCPCISSFARPGTLCDCDGVLSIF